MAKSKRRGANSRKNYVRKKKRLASRVKRVLPMTTVTVVLVIAGISLFASGTVSIGKVVAAVEKSDFFRVKKIAVKGTKRFEKAEIVRLAGIETPIKIYKVKVASVVATLRAEPWIEKARCIKKWWGTVVIEIKERNPVALIHVGEISLVDTYGFILPMEPGTDYVLPLIHGIKVKSDSDGRRFVDSLTMKRINVFMESLGNDDRQWMEAISQVDMSNSSMARCYVKDADLTVSLPYEVDRKKLRNLRYMMRSMERENSGESIDLRYDNIAFVSMAAENKE
jgi:cell division septal protein FtsQ